MLSTSRTTSAGATIFIVSPTVSDEIRSSLKKSIAALTPAQAELVEISKDDDFDQIIARCVAQQPAIIAAVGGDGTVASVAHGVADTDINVAIVPAGTGNLVARELGIPLDTRKAIGLIAGPHNLRTVDAMLINNRTYLLNVGVGVNAEVISSTTRLEKDIFGRGAYAGSAVRETLMAATHPLRVTIDGTPHQCQASDLLVSNCGALARILYPNGPEIVMDDGLLNLCIVSMKVPLEYPWFYFLRKLFPKKTSGIVKELTARRSITIECDHPISVQADGDLIGTTPLEITLLPKAVPIIVPEN